MPVKKQSPLLYQIGYFKNFVCQGDKCPYTCCRGWLITVENANYALWKKSAPELMDTCTKCLTRKGRKMLKDEKDLCVCLKDGRCSIQEKYQEKFQPTICTYFPRVDIRLKNRIYQRSHLVCFGVTKLALYAAPEDFYWQQVPALKMQKNMLNSISIFKKYPYLKSDQIMAIHNQFMRLVNQENGTADHLMAKLLLVAKLMDELNSCDWSNRFFTAITKESLEQISSPYFERKQELKKIIYTVDCIIEDYLKTNYNNDGIKKITNKLEKLKSLNYNYKHTQQFENSALDQILKNILRLKLNRLLFPILKTESYLEQMIVICFEYFIFRLLLIASCDNQGNLPDKDDICSTVQAMDRTMNIKLAITLAKEDDSIKPPNHENFILLLLDFEGKNDN